MIDLNLATARTRYESLLVLVKRVIQDCGFTRRWPAVLLHHGQ